MTTEDDFQAALDAEPSDWQTRLVFADWLADRDDPRAEGYRALGTLRKRAFVGGFDNPPTKKFSGAAWFGNKLVAKEVTFDLPDDWFGAIEGLGDATMYRPSYSDADAEVFTRRQVEDAAALAFGALPPERRAELLASPPTVVKARRPRKTRRRSKG